MPAGGSLLFVFAMSAAGAAGGADWSAAEASPPGREVAMDKRSGAQEREAGVRVRIPACANHSDKRTRLEKAQADPPLDKLQLDRCPGPRTKIGVAPKGPTKY